MRLIDADKLLEPGYTDMFDAPIRFAMVSRNAIETAPTVDAIPVEFIEKQIAKYNDWNEDVEPLLKLIEDWRKVNEKSLAE